MKKLTHLEGMRGLMAVNVILCHFVCVYYPQMYFSGYEDSSLSCFYSTPLSALVNGNIAVVFFFALTGFLVGMSVFIKNTDASMILQKSKNRYTRLLPVIIIATLFTVLTMIFGLQYHLQISNPRVNMKFLSEYCNFEPSLKSLIANIFFLPFVDYSAYIGPFWTIKYEFWGYIIILIAAIALKDSKWRRLIYLAIMLVMSICLDSYYMIFIMGLLVADLQFNKTSTVLSKIYQKLILNKVFIVLCFFVSAYFACCPMHENSPIYSFWFKLPLIDDILLRGFGMSLFIFTSLNLRIIQKILSVKPLVFLGKCSFETYALHWPIMLSLEAGLFLIFEKQMNYDYAALLSFAITIPVIYLSSISLNFFVNKTTKLINKYICKESLSNTSGS